ncbi:MAG: zinc ribbon domain-containing protein [Chloroflexi bacterium]|nr:zinc ribbon domain-containing protein [Chloroflexota bacterium]
MNDLLGPFRRKAQDLIDSINSSGGLRATVEGLRKQMAESDRRRALHRAQAELKQLDAQIKEMITAVGVQAVGLHRAGRLTSPELAPLCAHVVELEAAVAQQREELARLESTMAPDSEAEEPGCERCGNPLPEGATFCPYCGEPATPKPRYCAACGAGLREAARFCARCGAAVP